MNVPDYAENSIVNLMATIQQSYGIKSEYSPLNSLSSTEFENTTNIVIIIVDGLGYNYFQTLGNDLPIAPNLITKLTSVFPTTTAAAVTSFYSGLAPQNHAVLAWFTYLRELGLVSTILPAFIRGLKTSFLNKFISPQSIYQGTSLFSKLPTKNYALMPKDVVNSPYNSVFSANADQVAYKSRKEFFQYLKNLCSNKPGRKFIFAYWPELDTVGHEYGMNSDKAKASARDFINEGSAFYDFVRNQKGSTRVLITADHGLIDATPNHIVLLEDHPDLYHMLTLPLCGEPRAAFCYVRAGKEDQFETYIHKHFEDCCELHKGEDLITQNYFGLGERHPLLNDRVGDYILLMKENYIFKDTILGEKRRILIGNHGGLSDEELYIPLFLI
jgi:predicted AlkP superfamily pyrophosphatase or phosphodiesterase